MIRKTVLIILAFFLFITNTSAASNIIKKEISAPAADGFNLKAVLSYPAVKGQTEYSTVVLLHSIGYSSDWWGDLPDELLNKGYAVLVIDLRGHGKSIYNSKLTKISWKNLKISAYAKYPDDIIRVIDEVKEENPNRNFFSSWAIVGADIGANAGILAADKMAQRPKTIVMISPAINIKGLFIPVSVAQLDDVDFLSITGTDDTVSKEAGDYLKKFAQDGFSEFVSESKTTGMLILKNDSNLSKMISEWISEYLN